MRGKSPCTASSFSAKPVFVPSAGGARMESCQDGQLNGHGGRRVLALDMIQAAQAGP